MKLVDRIGRRLKLRDLHVLLAVAEHGSMAKAAQDLAISQPVISKAIADLEHTVGVRLLDRSRHGVTPTPYGRALLRRSLAAFDELREGVKEIEFLSEPTAGEVRVGALAAMMVGLLPVAINAIRNRHPRIILSVRQLTTHSRVYDTLRQRTVDFVIGRIVDPAHQSDLEFEILFAEPLFVVAGVQSRWARRRRLVLADLQDEPWILPQPDTEVGKIVGDVFHASGLARPRAAVICNSIEMYWALLAAGNFVAILPGSILRFSPQRGTVKVLPIRVPVQPGPVGIATLKNRTLSPAVQVFIDQLRTVAKPLTK